MRIHSNSEALNLTIDSNHVGELHFVGHSIHGFSYSPTWISHGFPLTPAMSDDHAIDSAVAKRFLVNLLPESDSLDVAARFLAISKLNLFALLPGSPEVPFAALRSACPRNSICNRRIDSFIGIEQFIRRLAGFQCSQKPNWLAASACPCFVDVFRVTIFFRQCPSNW